MTPREHLEMIVRPNMAEISNAHGDIRKFFNAATSLDALAASIYWWAAEKKCKVVQHLKDDDAYRRQLRNANEDFRLASEIARATKHIKVNSTGTVKHVSQVTAIELMVDDALSWDDMRFDTPTQVAVLIPAIPGATGSYAPAAAVLERALAFLELEMRSMGAA